MGLTIFFLKFVVIKNFNECFFLTNTKLKMCLIPNGKKNKTKKLFCVTLSEKTAYFITVLSKIFMQIFNLFLYLENAGVMWAFVKVLKRTVFTVITYVNCHL